MGTIESEKDWVINKFMKNVEIIRVACSLWSHNCLHRKGKKLKKIEAWKENFYRLWKLKAFIEKAKMKAKRTVHPRTTAATTPRKSWSKPK